MTKKRLCSSPAVPFGILENALVCCYNGGDPVTGCFITLNRKRNNMSKTTSRRQFLQTSSALTAGAALVGGLTISQSAHAAGSDEIKLALIGCGGRGRGAIRDRVQVGDNCKVVAIADAFEGAAKGTANGLRTDGNKEDDKLYKKVDLPEDRVFSGIDSYKQAIACLNPGDQVVLASPPGFRPWHYRAAIERGCHVFMEKPLFVDAPGFRHTMETNKMAEEKNLKVFVGLQRRAEPHYYNWVDQIHAGKIGDVQYSRVFWNGGTPWTRHRSPGQSEMEFQVNNWYHFVWACGENICEQHVHNLDIGNWVHSKGDRMGHPVQANAMGGRTIRTGADSVTRQAPPFSDRAAWDQWYQANKSRLPRHGQAWDHFFVEFVYADGSRMFSQCRHIPNTWGHVAEYIYGTAGRGTPGKLTGMDGKDFWLNSEKAVKGPYQWEHDLLVKAIREDKPMHEGWAASMATMCAVLGREAAYYGKELKWDDLVEKGRSYFPTGEVTSFEQTAPVQPDADGFYESSVPVPGVYNPFV